MFPPRMRSRLAGLILTSLFLAPVGCGGGTSPLAGTGRPPPVGPTHPDGGSTLPDGGSSVCGDGLPQGAEACDDGNASGGDGCSADCSAIESGWECLKPGKECSRIPVCGNGTVDRDERCDDKNTTPGDGCDATCQLEPGWTCPAGGGRCRATACGDGILAGLEQCEDGNTTDGDGCGATCNLEPGYKCPTVGQPCEATTCGDTVTEGTEQCDDGNNDMGDGCSPLCTREPQCTDGVCTAVCGDGVILPNDTTEECDDGNVRSNDGCSSECKLEAGFQCELITQAPPDTVEIPVVYRDFVGNDLGLPQSHIDFQNKNGAETGIVRNQLGADGKPVYAKTGNSSSTTHGAEKFNQWYRDTAGVNKTVASTLSLARQTDGSYVFDDQTFFPLDEAGWVAEGVEPLRNDADGVKRNFHFTSETRYWFEYKGTEQLTFRGDDDVWVFINGKLAIDLGGVHSAATASVMLADRAAELGLTVGGIYEVVVFQAERRTTRSSYKLTLNDFLTSRTECDTTCGDGMVQEGEECDDGVNDGGYAQCAPGCVWGPQCGDGIVQSEHGEACDDANSNESDGCNSLCRIVLN